MTAQIIVVFLFGLSIGSGVALKRAGPTIFFYIATPLLSAIAMVVLLEQVEIPGIDFEFDKMMPMVIANQSALMLVLGKGLACGLVLQWLYRRLFVKVDRRMERELAMIDGDTPMTRRKYLKVLGLKTSAGPRDILMAWTKLSAEAKSPDWRDLPRRRKSDISPAERLRQVNEAYNWLLANPKKSGVVRPAKVARRTL